MTEAAIVDAITRLLARRGAWAFKTHGNAHGRNGIPDIVGAYHGHALAIEVKRPGNHPTRLQRFELDRAARAGAHAIVAHSIDDVRAALDQIDAEEARHTIA